MSVDRVGTLTTGILRLARVSLPLGLRLFRPRNASGDAGAAFRGSLFCLGVWTLHFDSGRLVFFRERDGGRELGQSWRLGVLGLPKGEAEACPQRGPS